MNENLRMISNVVQTIATVGSTFYFLYKFMKNDISTPLRVQSEALADSIRQLNQTMKSIDSKLSNHEKRLYLIEKKLEKKGP